MIKNPDELSGSLQAALKDYAKLQEEIANDTNVKSARTRLRNAMAAYDERLGTLNQYIKAHVMELEESVMCFGVTVNHRKEHTKVKWDTAKLNELYEEYEDILDSAKGHTVVKPSVTIKYAPIKKDDKPKKQLIS